MSLFSTVAETEWNDWRWQTANRVTDMAGLRRFWPEATAFDQGIEEAGAQYQWAVTPYYLKLIDPADPNDPLALQVLPDRRELLDLDSPLDPLLEQPHSPVQGLIHLYPDRVAFCVSNVCHAYCRHCFRKRRKIERDPATNLDAAIEYIRTTPTVRDVLVTGGDPLMLATDVLCKLLARLREIPHVEILRVGTRAPVTLPMRVTEHLAQRLSEFHPLYINTQFNHPREITPEAALACDRLSRAGIPLGNQSVLLAGVNDDVETMRALVHGLLKIRVRPYYVFHPQIVQGSAHTRVPLDKGLAIHRALEGFTSGLAVPLYILDTPYGKVPLAESRIVGRTDKGFLVKSFEGKLWEEPDEG